MVVVRIFLILVFYNLFSMKPYALALVLYCAAFSAFSQSPDAEQDFIRKKCGVLYVQLSPGQNDASYPVLFDSIRVVDSRSDTSRIGLIGSARRGQDEVLFHRPAGMQVAAYLDAEYVKPQGKYSMLVDVKDLWVSGSGNRRDDKGRPVWNVDFRFEAYLKTDGGYIPLTYLDTLAPAEGTRPEDMVGRYLPQLIAVFMDKVAHHVMTDDLVKKRVVSYDQIDSFSRTRFNYPMDTATLLVKGVYMNVREFRDNKPSKRQYEISKDESGDLTVSIADENGQFYYTRKVWGFCDGQGAYKMMNGNLFPIFNVYHQLYVLGSSEYRNKRTALPVLLPVFPGLIGLRTIGISDNVSRLLRLFRLDPYTGKTTE